MSFSIALSGLNASNSELNNISNNIANVETTGYKESRTEFAAVYSANTANGVEVSGTSQNFDKVGNISGTGRTLDLAISGSGFFQTTDTSNQVLYTRSGAFQLASDGTIISSAGNALQGYTVNANYNLQSGVVENIVIDTAPIEAKATTSLEFVANFDSREEVPTIAFDPEDAESFNHSYTSLVYDSQGNTHTVNQYFVKTATNNWDVYTKVDDTVISEPVTTTVIVDNYTGDLDGDGVIDALYDANSDGVLDQMIDLDGDGTPEVTVDDNLDGILDDPVPVTTSVTVDAPKVATTLAFNLDGSISGDVGYTLDVSMTGVEDLSIDVSLIGSTQFGSDYAVSTNAPDGYSAGDFVSVNVENNGMIFASYTNGQTQLQGQVILANFVSPQELLKVSDTSWVQTFASGAPITNAPGVGVLGEIESASLESSNVDLTAELVSLMTAQRNYQANTKTISTYDQLTQALFNAI